MSVNLCVCVSVRQCTSVGSAEECVYDCASAAACVSVFQHASASGCASACVCVHISVCMHVRMHPDDAQFISSCLDRYISGWRRGLRYLRSTHLGTGEDVLGGCRLGLRLGGCGTREKVRGENCKVRRTKLSIA